MAFKILAITHWFPTDQDPVTGIFVREHTRAIALLNDVTVLHIQGITSGLKKPIEIVREEDPPLIIFRLRYQKSPIPRVTWTRRFIGTHRLFHQLAASANRPDIVHAHIYSSADLAAYLQMTEHVPGVLSEHASVYPRNLLTYLEAQRARFSINFLRRVMPVSENLLHHMQRYGIRGPFKVIANTVDTRLFHPELEKLPTSNQETQLLTVCSLNRNKSVHLLLEALTNLLEYRQDFHLTVIGDGPERVNIQSQIVSSGLKEKVTLSGMKPKPAVAAAMQNADLFILTSLWENQPVVLIEAMACGIPVLAPEVGGIPEIVKPFCGQLFEVGNVSSIASVLSSVMDNLGSYSKTTISNYAQEHFSYPMIANQFNFVYHRVLEEARS
jgi:glycosyltransferase involved in cell wall biosynthesis